MTVAELLERISSSELSEWMAYYQVEPFGQERDNLHAGIIASVFANANRDRKKQKKPFTIKDFMLSFKKDKPKKSPEQMLQFVEMLNAAMGGKDLRSKAPDEEKQRLRDGANKSAMDELIKEDEDYEAING